MLLAGAAIPVSAYGQCVTDTPAVDACRGGVRVTGATALPPGASLSLNFMTPGTLDPLITFTRASTGTYFASTGTMQTAAANAPRWDYDPVSLQLRGLLLEDTRTNLLLNSATLGTQSIAVTAQIYALSFYGTGTVTKSGAATGALAGTGPGRVLQTFTPTAGTLTLTVTGSVSNAQLEACGANGFASSYIPTISTAATRAIDSCMIASANMAPWFAPPGGSWFADFDYSDIRATSQRVLGRPDISSGPSPFYVNNTTAIAQYDGVGVVLSANTTTPLAVVKAATAWAAGAAKVCANGGAVATAATLTTGYAIFSSSGIRLMASTGATGEVATGHIRRVTYWPRVLSDAEMQQVTT